MAAKQKRMKTQNENQVPVSDLGLASFLVTLHFQMVGMEWADKKRINFLENLPQTKRYLLNTLKMAVTRTQLKWQELQFTYP